MAFQVRVCEDHGVDTYSDDFVSAAIDAMWHFWFGDHDVFSEDYEYPLQLWFNSSWPVDVYLRQRFGPLHQTFLDAVLDGARGRSTASALIRQWQDVGQRQRPARGHVALALLLDQFSRNIHRGTRHMFTMDVLTLPIALEVLDTPELLESISRPEKLTLSLCLTHAENLDAARRCVAIRKQLRSEVPNDNKKLVTVFDLSVMYGAKHHEIIKLFGRYPHRNRLLGRTTTPEEEAYLRDNQQVDFMRSVEPIAVPAAAQERIARYLEQLDSTSPRWVPLALLQEWHAELQAADGPEQPSR